ncbi:phage antirepressor protein [Xylella fastidiosa]|uniref:phage antirepressor protein n=1 Tax=Xylella fastidiosa TaxID=2371 RepID=UPI0012D2F460|nr:phage antirepressor protein [Xylella fastidiosa]
MTQLPAAVCFSGKSLSIIDHDGVPHLTAADLARALGYKDTVSLTTVRRCGTVASKEIKNSEHSGTRIRNPCGFFTPARFYVGRAAAIQHPVKGKAARRLCSVFDLPTPTGAARKNVSPWSSHNTGDVL